jgi:sugar phosphate isomerase/epimerase
MMTYTMSRQGYGVKDFIKAAVDYKLDGIDWVTNYGHCPKELKKMSDDAGLTVACYTFFLNKFMNNEVNWLDEVKQSLEDAINIGTSIVMIPTPPLANITNRKTGQQNWINALKKVAPLALDASLTLTIENYPGYLSPFVIANDYYKAKSEIQSLKLTYDNGNAAGGEDPVESFKRCANNVVHAHFKDWYISDIPQEGYCKFLDGKYYKPALIGQGDINTAGVWETMKEFGYKGYINIEYESDDIKAPQGVQMAVEYLRSL